MNIDKEELQDPLDIAAIKYPKGKKIKSLIMEDLTLTSIGSFRKTPDESVYAAVKEDGNLHLVYNFADNVWADVDDAEEKRQEEFYTSVIKEYFKSVPRKERENVSISLTQTEGLEIDLQALYDRLDREEASSKEYFGLQDKPYTEDIFDDSHKKKLEDHYRETSTCPVMPEADKFTIWESFDLNSVVPEEPKEKLIRRFETGAVRSDSTGRPRPDWVSPYAIDAISMRMVGNQDDFGSCNYLLGIPELKCLESLCRHVQELKEALLITKDFKAAKDIAAAAGFNVTAMLHTMVLKEKGLYKKIYDKEEELIPISKAKSDATYTDVKQ